MLHFGVPYFHADPCNTQRVGITDTTLLKSLPLSVIGLLKHNYMHMHSQNMISEHNRQDIRNNKL